MAERAISGLVVGILTPNPDLAIPGEVHNMDQRRRHFLIGACITLLFGVYLYDWPSNWFSWIGRLLFAWGGGLVLPGLYEFGRGVIRGEGWKGASPGSVSDFILFRAGVYCQYLCMEHNARCMDNALHTMVPGMMHKHPIYGQSDGWVHLQLHHFDMEAGLEPAKKLKSPQEVPVDGGE